MQATIPDTFDAIQYKQTTLDQWENAADAWYRWSPLLSQWLGNATEKMLDMTGVSTGHRVLDIAAGAGEQSIAAAKKTGASGHVLATDISPNILSYARKLAGEAGISNISTAVMDGEDLDLPDVSFDAVISRVGLIYFPDQQKALREMLRVLKCGSKMGAIVYSTPEKNKFFSVPISIIRKRANLPAPPPGKPGPFSLGVDGVIEKAFTDAGFVNIDSIKVTAPLSMPSAKLCVQFERESFGALHQMMRELDEREKHSLWSEIEEALKEFEQDNWFTGPCEMIVCVGEKPGNMKNT